MIRVCKDLAKVGRYKLLDGRVVDITHADLREADEHARAMRNLSLSVPVIDEHRWGAEPAPPLRLSQQEHGLGELTTTWLSGDTLWGEMVFPTAAAAERARKQRFVSPEFRTDFTDVAGRRWLGKVLSHVAVTNTPVWQDQRPVRLSRAGEGPVVRLSLADLTGPTRIQTPWYETYVPPKPKQKPKKRQMSVATPARTNAECLREMLSLMGDMGPGDGGGGDALAAMLGLMK